MICAACNHSLCDCPDLVFAGIQPTPFGRPNPDRGASDGDLVHRETPVCMEVASRPLTGSENSIVYGGIADEGYTSIWSHEIQSADHVAAQYGDLKFSANSVTKLSNHENPDLGLTNPLLVQDGDIFGVWL